MVISVYKQYLYEFGKTNCESIKIYEVLYQFGL